MLDAGAEHGAAEAGGAGGCPEDRQPGCKSKGAHNPLPTPSPTRLGPARPTPASGTSETQMILLTMGTLMTGILNNGAADCWAANDRTTDNGCRRQ